MDYVPSTGSAATRLVTGSSVGLPPSAAMDVKLTALPDAELPRASTCASDDPASFAGFVRFEQWHSAGRYEISVAPDAWIDVVQDDADVPPVAISGAVACPGRRKSGQFELRASAVLLQITRVPADHVTVTVSLVPMEVAGASLSESGSRVAVSPGNAVAEKADATEAAPSPMNLAPPAEFASRAASPLPASELERLVPGSWHQGLPAVPTREIAQSPTHSVDESSNPPPRPVDLRHAKRDKKNVATMRSVGKSSRQRVEPPAPSSARAPTSRSAAAIALAPPAAPATPTPGTASAANASDPNAWLLQRGDDFLRTRDIAAARQLYERAAVAGSARGAMLVGKTYDPLYFAEIGAHGSAADRTKASEEYGKAAGLGAGEAAARVQKLGAGARQP